MYLRKACKIARCRCPRKVCIYRYPTQVFIPRYLKIIFMFLCGAAEHKPLSQMLCSELKKIFQYNFWTLIMGVFFFFSGSDSKRTGGRPTSRRRPLVPTLGGQKNSDFLLLIDEDAILQGCTLFPFPAQQYAVWGKKTSHYI